MRRDATTPARLGAIADLQALIDCAWAVVECQDEYERADDDTDFRRLSRERELAINELGRVLRRLEAGPGRAEDEIGRELDAMAGGKPAERAER